MLQSDTTYNKGSVNSTSNFFKAFMPVDSVFFETRVDSPHLVPGIDPYLCWWEEWAGPVWQGFSRMNLWTSHHHHHRHRRHPYSGATTLIGVAWVDLTHGRVRSR